MARQMLHLVGMRPVSILFVMAGLGFLVVLHKQDAPEGTNLKMKASQRPKAAKSNWMKRSLDTSRTVANTVKEQRREDEVQ
jgi:hypothetical protein